MRIGPGEGGDRVTSDKARDAPRKLGSLHTLRAGAENEQKGHAPSGLVSSLG
jgi:hypothetical protein